VEEVAGSATVVLPAASVAAVSVRVSEAAEVLAASVAGAKPHCRDNPHLSAYPLQELVDARMLIRHLNRSGRNPRFTGKRNTAHQGDNHYE
jgi:hypothetical protein